MIELKASDFERDLVSMDKQKIISYCLKLLSVNKEMAIHRVRAESGYKELTEINKEITNELERLHKKTVWEWFKIKMYRKLNRKK